MLLGDITSGSDGRVVRYDAVNAINNAKNFRADDEFSYFCFGNKACQKRAAAKSDSKNKARETKAGAKATEAEAKKVSAEASKEGVKGDVAFADAIKASAPIQAIQGMSTPKKIAIGVGALIVLGGIAYGIYYMKKKK